MVYDGNCTSAPPCIPERSCHQSEVWYFNQDLRYLLPGRPPQQKKPMNSNYKLAMALVAGAAIGGAAIQGLHAQAKPPIYLVTEIDVSNAQAYGKDYAPKAQASIKAAGGKQIAIGGAGGAGAGKVIEVEGAAPKRVVIQIWDSVEKMQAWRNSADYKAARTVGDKYAKFRSYAVDGLPQ
jgi:uncharacterized protein (DUF1330 family)